MGHISTKSAFDSPMKLRFRGRAVMSAKMAHAIKRAFVISPQARVAQRHDLDLDKPVMFAHPDDAYAVSSQRVPSHMIVCTDRGGECIVSLYLVGQHYEALVHSGADTRVMVANHVGLNYTQYAFDTTGQTWNDQFEVIGLETLFADADGEFAGALVDGSQLLLDDDIPNTTATWRVGYEPVYAVEGLPVPDVSELDVDDAELFRLFQRELGSQQVESKVEVTA